MSTPDVQTRTGAAAIWWLILAALALALAAAPHAQAPAAPPSATPAQTPSTSGNADAARDTAAASSNPLLERLKREAIAEVEARRSLTQQMIDQVFSFGEPAFQEIETSRYLTDVLEKNGFRVERGYAGIPTAWVATWGSGHPVISLGSDEDALLESSQKPGVTYRDPLVPGAPGHGEGHNSGVPLNITAALAVKAVLEREHLPGTLKLWPGIAEEVVGAKAYFVKAGLFADVDVSLFAHVGSNFNTAWGSGNGTGLQSVEYTFTGESAHAAMNPWRGRSALDAVELMDVGWNFRREHLRLSQRSHYVITDGGAQPNVVPSTASVWYYLRETDPDHVADLRRIADHIAHGAAEMTDTTVRSRLLGSAWLAHMNRPIAEALSANIAAIGLPAWDDADQQLARAVQKEVGQQEIGLAAKLQPIREGIPPEQNTGGGSDDIGDVSWTVPTASLTYPANIPNLPGHHWSNAVAMATPIAHKGVTAGAKAQALTVLDLLLRPELVEQARTYFREQTKTQQYHTFIGPDDVPAIHLNERTLAAVRPAMRQYYYDPTRYRTYLEQLGIVYPTLRQAGR